MRGRSKVEGGGLKVKTLRTTLVRPSTFDFHSLAFNHQPSTINHQPSTFNLRPSTFPMPDTLHDLPALYLEGLRLFNEEDFFECHEVLEELWAETDGEPKKYLQGLIQAAVALFHFGNENYGGAKKLYLSSTKLLNNYGTEYMGLALGRFLQDFAACFAELLANTEAYPTTVALQDELVPKFYLIDES
jgi:uncharacterized protein